MSRLHVRRIDAEGVTTGWVVTAGADGKGDWAPQVDAGSAAPIGPAGGVLSGTYPDPGFAVNMATQAELDAAIAAEVAARDAAIAAVPETVQSQTFSASGAALEIGLGKHRFYNHSGAARELLGSSASLGTPGTEATTVDLNLDGVTVYTTQANRPAVPANGNVSPDQVPNVTSWPNGSYLTVDVDTLGTGADHLVVEVQYR